MMPATTTEFTGIVSLPEILRKALGQAISH
jgi:hypothetical protein